MLPFIHAQNCSSGHVFRAPHGKTQSYKLLSGWASTRVPLLVEKPIVRSPRPSEFNECLRADINASINIGKPQRSRASLKGRLPSIVCDDQVQQLSLKRLYTSTTREATEEAALPTPRINAPSTTLELDADPVRCRRAVRYAPRPSQWQRYAREWDATQLRKSSDGDDVGSNIILPQIVKNCSKTQTLQCLNDAESTTQKAFLRPMPGYGGFIPRHAVEPRNQTDASSDCMCSTTRRTYRKFPVCEYRVLEHAHKGPFSKTVTMTHPLNPFNKVEHHPRVY